MLRSFIWYMRCALAATVLLCAGQGWAQEPTKLTVWMTDARLGYKTWLEKYAAEYKKVRPGVQVEIVQMGSNDAFLKWPAAAAAGNLPDITWMVFGTSAWMDEMKGGGFVPMDDVVDRLGRDRFVPHALESWRYKGRLLCAPVARTPSYLFYRKDLFQAAGLAEPKTWADVVAAAKALTVPEKGQYGIIMPGKTDFSPRFAFSAILYSNGGHVVSPKGEAALDSPEAVAALKIYGELFKYSPPGAISAGFAEIQRALAQGSVAMVITNPAVMTQFLKANPSKAGMIGAAIPSDVGLTDTIQNQRGWCVFKSSKHQEEAKRFIEFLFKTESFTDYLSAAAVSSFPVYRDDKALSLFLERDETARAFPDTVRQIMALDRGTMPGIDRIGQNPKAGMILSDGLLERHINRYLAKKGDPNTTAQEMQAELKEILKK